MFIDFPLGGFKLLVRSAAAATVAADADMQHLLSNPLYSFCEEWRTLGGRY